MKCMEVFGNEGRIEMRIVLVILTALLMIGILGCGTSAPPSDVAQKWLDAWARGDIQTMRKYTISYQVEELDWSLITASSIMALPTIEREVIVSDTSAYVVVTFPDGGFSQVWLKNEDGWKVDVYKTVEEF